MANAEFTPPATHEDGLDQAYKANKAFNDMKFEEGMRDRSLERARNYASVLAMKSEVQKPINLVTETNTPGQMLAEAHGQLQQATQTFEQRSEAAGVLLTSPADLAALEAQRQASTAEASAQAEYQHRAA